MRAREHWLSVALLLVAFEPVTWPYVVCSSFHRFYCHCRCRNVVARENSGEMDEANVHAVVNATDGFYHGEEE